MGDSLADRLAAARSSADPDLLVNLGSDLSIAEDHLGAAWCFAAALGLGDRRAAFNLGNELAELGRDSDAIDTYKDAIAAGVNDAWLNLGIVLERLGDLAGALHAYERGQAVGDMNAGMARAFLLREIDHRELANDIVDELAAAGSAYADAVAACWLYNQTLDPGLEGRLRAGAELFPAARTDLASILRSTGRVEEAVATLNKGVALGEVEAYLPLAVIHVDDLGDVVAAEAIYRAGIAAGDNHCHLNLGRLLVDQDRLDEARQHYELGSFGGDALAQRALAQLDED